MVSTSFPVNSQYSTPILAFVKWNLELVPSSIKLLHAHQLSNPKSTMLHISGILTMLTLIETLHLSRAQPVIEYELLKTIPPVSLIWMQTSCLCQFHHFFLHPPRHTLCIYGAQHRSSRLHHSPKVQIAKCHSNYSAEFGTASWNDFTKHHLIIANHQNVVNNCRIISLANN